MKTKHVLLAFLVLMGALIVVAAFNYGTLRRVLNFPELYHHFLFVHAVSATLFFANALVGMLWELRSLVDGRKEVVLHTYETVAWLDARFSSPFILVSVLSGILLSFMIGDLFQIGWLSWSFVLFNFSGLFWVLSDIPTQYKVRALTAAIKPEDKVLPVELDRLLRLRWWISLVGVVPLVVVFALMVYKPDIPAIGALFR